VALQLPDRVGRAVAGLATLTALVLACAFLAGAGGLWRDEVNSVVVASSPSLRSLWRRLEFESFPALWPLGLAVWLRVAGESDVSLRIFGVLGGLSLVSAVWFALRRLGGGVPLVSLVVVVMNPEIVTWGSSVRAWGPGAALAILVVVAMWEAVRRPGLATACWAALFSVLAVQCTYQNAFVVLAAGLSAAGCAALAGRPRAAAGALAAGAVAAASLLPYVETLQRIADWNALNRVSLTTSVVLARLFRVAFAREAPVTLAAWIGLAGAAMWLTMRAAVFRSRRWTIDDPATLAVYLMATACAAAACLVGLYTIAHYPPYSWYYIVVIAVVAVSSEAAVRRLAPGTTARVVLASAALTVIAAGLPAGWASVRQPRSNLDAIGARLTTEAGPSDLVVVHPWLYGITLGRYYRGAAPLLTLPPLADFSVHRFDLLKAQMQAPGAADRVAARIEQTLRQGGRVWVVGDDPVRTGNRPVAALPPPPHPVTGWAVRPYVLAWGDQIGLLLARRAATRERLAVGVSAQPLEDAELLRFSGWKGSEAATPATASTR
jgi:hypothetical protein